MPSQHEMGPLNQSENEFEKYNKREKHIADLFEKYKDSNQGDRFDFFEKEVNPVAGTLLESGNFEFLIFNKEGKKEWGKPQRKLRNKWIIEDSYGEEHPVYESDVVTIIADGHTNKIKEIRKIDGSDIDESLRQEMLELIVRSAFTTVFDKKVEVNLRSLFYSTHSPHTEIATGFEPESFLETTKKGVSVTKKMEEFGEKYSEQISSIESLMGMIEENILNGASSEQVISLIEKTPDFLKLSREQKFNLRRGVFRLEGVQKNIQRFFGEHKDLNPTRQAMRLVDDIQNFDYEFKGQVAIQKEINHVEIHVASGEDYDFFYSRGGEKEKENRSGGFKIDSIFGFPVIVLPQEIRTPENINGKINYHTEIVDQETRDRTRNHEIRHARNALLMPSESSVNLRRAKDEIIAYLQNGKDLGEIEEILVYDSQYNYELQGDDLKNHREKVLNMIKKLKRMPEGQINLDALAISPTRLWPYVVKNMHLFTGDTHQGNQKVEFIRGSLLVEKVDITQRLLEEVYKEFDAEQPISIIEFIKKYKDQYDRKDVLKYSFIKDLVDKKIFRSKDYNEMRDYIGGDKNISLYTQDIDIVEYIEYTLDDIVRTLNKDVSLYYRIHEKQFILDKGYPEDPQSMYQDIENKRGLFYAKLFYDLRLTDDPELKELWQKLKQSTNDPLEINGQKLNTLQEKIMFARARHEEYLNKKKSEQGS